MDSNNYLNENELRERLIKLAKDTGGATQLSKKLDVTSTYVHRAMKGRDNIGPKLANALGYERVVLYKEIAP